MSYAKAMKHANNPRRFKMTATRVRGNQLIFGPFPETVWTKPSREDFMRNHPTLKRATEKLDRLRSADSSRWGETRRFAGRSAGIRLEAIERAERFWSRAYSQAETAWEKLA